MRFVVCLLAVALMALPGRADLEDNGDGTVKDPSTGLQWTQRGNGEDITLMNAAAFCEALELADFDDWRLPTRAEVRTVADSFRGPGPFWASDGAIAQKGPGSTPVPSDPWEPEDAADNEALAARCVRQTS